MSEKLKDAKFNTGAVRSADIDDYDFSSMPLIGLLGVLRIAGNGGTKYARFNYMKGMPVHVTLNHVAVHLIKYILGDRKEDHLSKVSWGAMVANQTALLQPELAEPHMLGPGATLTPALLAEMDKGAEERERKREDGEFEELFHWTLADLPEVKEIVRTRKARSWARAVGKTVSDYVKNRQVSVAAQMNRKFTKPTRTESHAPRGTVAQHWSPGSINARTYGNPTRTEPAAGEPRPRDDEAWFEFEDGTRAYFKKTGLDRASEGK